MGVLLSYFLRFFGEKKVWKMKKFLKKVLPRYIVDCVRSQRILAEWKKTDFTENSPQFFKQKVFLKYGIKGAVWVETGTHVGTTTQYLSELFPHIYSIEPEPKLYASACERFKGRNVTMFNNPSEKVLSSILPKLKGDINFWLDGHYSGGVTFRGEKIVQ